MKYFLIYVFMFLGFMKTVWYAQLIYLQVILVFKYVFTSIVAVYGTLKCLVVG